MPSGILYIAAGLNESTNSQDQTQYANKGDVTGSADGLGENVKTEPCGKQIEQADQRNDSEEVHNSDSKILFHFHFLLICTRHCRKAAIR